MLDVGEFLSWLSTALDHFDLSSKANLYTQV